MPFLEGLDLTYRDGRGLKTPLSFNFGIVIVGSDNFCVIIDILVYENKISLNTLQQLQ